MDKCLHIRDMVGLVLKYLYIAFLIHKEDLHSKPMY